MTKKNNRGVTLVELIATMAILAILGVALVSFINVVIHHFKSSRAETTLQYEAQLANNQIHDMLIDVSAGVGYDTDTHQLLFYDWDDSTGTDKKVVSKVSWNQTAEKLYLSTYEIESGSTTPVPIQEDSLMAEYVTGFNVTLPIAATSREVSYQIDFSKDGHTYTAQNVVTLRNDVTVNGTDIEKIFNDITVLESKVSAVDVSPASATILRGGSQKFAAAVTGDNWPSQEVTWSIEGNKDETTKINANGLLTLGASETSQKIQVIARSAQDNTIVCATPAVVVTSYLDSISFSRVNLSEGKEQTVSLTLSGENLNDSAIASPKIDTESVSGVTVALNDKTTGENNQLVYSNMTISCDDTVAYESTIMVSVTVKYGPDTKTASISFNTGKKANPITDIKLADANGTEISTALSLDRGATQDLYVYVQRGNDGDWTRASEDGGAEVTWTNNIDTVSGHSDYADCTASSDKDSLNVLKDPSKLSYYSNSGLVNITASVSDTVGGGSVISDTRSIVINEVTLEFYPKYSNYGLNYYGYYTTRDASWGGTVYFIADVTGIVLNKDEDLHWLYDNSAYCFNMSSSVNATDGGYQISSNLTLSNQTKSYDRLYVYCIIGQVSNGTYVNGSYYKYCYLDIHKNNLKSGSSYLPYYIPTSLLSTNYYLPDGSYVSYERYWYWDRYYYYYYINFNGGARYQLYAGSNYWYYY